MKVFISWSGKLSQAVALELRDWLPAVIQSIDPYVSSEDIEKGARWGSEVSKELETSDFGILCITPTNTGAPWLNFEAGALSKSIDRSRVVPFLFRLDRADLPQGPLVQFQSVLAEKDEVRKLVLSLNGACGESGLEEPRLEGFFEHWWPKLRDSLRAIKVEDADAADPQRTDQDVLSEVLEIVRGQTQLLSNPETLLPPVYVESLLHARKGFDEPDPGAVRHLHRTWQRLQAVIADSESDSVPPEMLEVVVDMSRSMNHVLRHLGAPVTSDLQRRLARERALRDDSNDDGADDD